ncbi:hypothetical protein BH09VER1_BH09VER1_00560 [soil metagenome]
MPACKVVKIINPSYGRDRVRNFRKKAVEALAVRTLFHLYLDTSMDLVHLQQTSIWIATKRVGLEFIAVTTSEFLERLVDREKVLS